jgi:hypothetical protein
MHEQGLPRLDAKPAQVINEFWPRHQLASGISQVLPALHRPTQPS